jgi:sulfide:quinone oxidoreductase
MSLATPAATPAPTGCPSRRTSPTCRRRPPPRTCCARCDGKPPVARFKVELICIVDTLDRGILVYRDEKRALILPPCRLMHWAKRFFEWQYLRPYLKARHS